MSPNLCNSHMEEWVGTTSAALSGVTTTITLSGTPTSASGQIIAYTGAKEPTGTVVYWAFDQATAFGTSNDQNSKCTNAGGSTAPQLSTGVTTLNANDLVLGLFGSENSVTETAGGGVTLRAIVAATGDSNAVEDSSIGATGSQTCPFGTTNQRWLLMCDTLQSAVKFYQVDPDVVSTTTTGIPSSSSPSGYAWIYNTAGIQNGLIDVQSGIWQFDMTIAASSTAGVGRIWITVWQCGSSTLT